MTATAKEFRCTGCGAPLALPQKLSGGGGVTCQYCGVVCVVDGLVKNAEMAAKDNINSGIPLYAHPETLHRWLVSFLAETPNLPPDIFEKGEVVREEHYCVAAYFYYCTGTASYTYDVADVKERTRTVYYNNRPVYQTERYDEWRNGMNGNANAKGAFFVSGNKQMAGQVARLYSDNDLNKLITYDGLKIPLDVQTYGYDLSEIIAFNDHVSPAVDNLLLQQARKMVANYKTRNFIMGTGSVKKEEMKRVLLCMYRIVLKYNNTEYSVWVSGDGSRAYHEGMPQDTQLQTLVSEKTQLMQKELSESAPETVSYKKPVIGIAIAALVGAFGMILAFAGAMLQGTAGTVILTMGGFFIFAGVVAGVVAGAIGIICCVTLRNKAAKSHNERCYAIRAKYQREISELQSAASNAVRHFIDNKQTLRGIFDTKE